MYTKLKRISGCAYGSQVFTDFYSERPHRASSHATQHLLCSDWYHQIASSEAVSLCPVAFPHHSIISDYLYVQAAKSISASPVQYTASLRATATAAFRRKNNERRRSSTTPNYLIKSTHQTPTVAVPKGDNEQIDLVLTWRSCSLVWMPPAK